MAFLKPAGTAPSVREQLTSLVIEGRRISKHSFNRKVGHGSSMQDLVGDLVITFRTSSIKCTQGIGHITPAVEEILSFLFILCMSTTHPDIHL